MGSNPSWLVSIKSGDRAGSWTQRHTLSEHCLMRREESAMGDWSYAATSWGPQRLGEARQVILPLQATGEHALPADTLISDQQPLQLWQHMAVVLSHLVYGYVLGFSRPKKLICHLLSLNVSDSVFSLISRSTMWLFQIHFFVFYGSCACIMASNLLCL